MQDLNDLALYAAVVKHKGFTAAATALGVPKSKISKRVAHLEEQLGVRLIERSTRKLRVTEIGQSFYERCETVLDGVEAAQAVVAAAKSEPAGLVRVAMPPGFAPVLAALLPVFLKRHPRVRLSIVMTNRPVDLIEEQFDIALRVRESYSNDQAVIVRKFGGTRAYLAASPAFLENNAPVTLDTLSTMATIAMHEAPVRAIWTLTNAEGELRDIAHHPVIACSDFGILERAAIEGIGIALLPDNIAERGFRNGLLVPVLPGWTSLESTIHAAFASRHGMLPAVRALIDFLAEHLARSMSRCRDVDPPRPLSADWSI
ncbi:LysR family transcriptional regulator [Rhizobium sp. TRM95111]|uniref:LysR family transcriptional regulator n=1 Tax=Rhizobium alarense TaxID=2846851 RepID=UPI001F3A181B|nr:LysR family transcriptional regulator [Rhizobium alarense]MCF3643101.1 LysR family transcriptional regulator [Rhizobium alarense]